MQISTQRICKKGYENLSEKKTRKIMENQSEFAERKENTVVIKG